MNHLEKIAQLRAEIHRQLDPLFAGKDCVLLDAPYHHNLGDVCIWEGEENYLTEVGSHILFRKSLFWTPGRHIDQSTVIALHGGGNFGDLYRFNQDFRLKIIAAYPNNRIVMFPQSQWYSDSALIKADAEAMSQHKDLWLCARDEPTYNLLCQHFSANHILLVPDMAFCISDTILNQHRQYPDSHAKLFMRRRDGEIVSNTPTEISRAYDIHDWPTFEHMSVSDSLVRRSVWIQCQLSKYIPALTNSWGLLNDNVFRRYFKCRYVNMALSFLGGYDSIVTTRLHALIIGTLLGKEIRYIDNRTGKLTDFATTWLSDMDTIKPFNAAEA